MILHVNIPSFPIEVERLVAPELRQRPVAIAASGSPRAPLLYVSAEAYGQGVRKGMSLRHARRLDRGLRCLTPEPLRYERAQQKLWQLVSRFSPVLEPLRLGAVFLDMRGMELIFGTAAGAADALRSELLNCLAMNPTVGLACNKLVARVAAKVMRPHGLYEVFPGHESEFLQPLPITYLPGIGRVNADRLLRELGVHCIGDLSQIPLRVLTNVFGSDGIELHRRAIGEDTSPVEAPRSSPTLKFEIIFRKPSNDDHFLRAQVWKLCEQAGCSLRSRKQVTSQSSLQGIYLDGVSIQKSLKYPLPTQSDFALFRPWQQLWPSFMQRRLQLKFLRLSLRGLQDAFTQLDFTADAREERLLKSLDHLRQRYGERAIVFCRK